ncbi:ammonium transporter-like [Bacillus rossius redtenbacheri]|uniref:ammonium transporter-like n=1 Tax=Bacillus rossius redtenbacheri TaxID=93214 RepID=UPI002FDE14D0
MPADDDDAWAGESLAAFLEVVLVLLMRAGFAATHAASAPAVPADLALLHHLVNLGAASVAHCLAGHAAAHSLDPRKVGGMWLPATAREWQAAAHGWSAAAASTAVLGAAAAGRMHLAGHAAAAALHAGLVLPLLARWRGSGWARQDAGGGVAVHAAGGAAALAASLLLGRRLVFPRELEPSWRVQAPAAAALGHALVAAGAAALCLPAPRAAAAALNSALAALGAVLAAVLLAVLVHDEWQPYWTVLGVLQAAVAGVVTVSSGANIFTPGVALLVGALGGAAGAETSRLLFRIVVEDPAGALSSHLACGALSGLLPPLLGSGGGRLPGQALGVAAALGVSSAAPALLLAALRAAGFLRTAEEQRQHRRAAQPRGRDTAFFRRLYPRGERVAPGVDYDDFF